MAPEMIDRDEALADVMKMVRRVAMLHLATAQTLNRELGREEGTRLTREVIKTYGRMIGSAVREKVLAENLEPSIENYSEDLPGLGFEAEVLATDPLTIKVPGCGLAQVWREYGEPELGLLYCPVDQAKYGAYNPSLVCEHKTLCLRDGGDYCEMVISGEEPA